MTRRAESAAALFAAALLLAACGAQRAGGPELDPLLCAESDLPFDFLEQTRGDFTADDLGGLSRDHEERKREYREAGMQGGRFVFWKEALPRPPFDHPVNVLCQVLVFRSAEEAASWVEGLRVAPEVIRDTGMLWTPVTSLAVAELPSENGRLFRLEADEDGGRTTIFALHEPRGNLVLSVFAGDRAGRATAETVLRIAAARDARLEEPTAGATSASR